MRAKSFFAFSLLAAGLTASDLETDATPGLRLNQVQVVGTHNSYHREPPAEATAWRQSEFVRQGAPSLAALATGYSHVALTEQLSRLGLRQLEIDLHPSEDGHDFPVLHHPVFDDVSNVPTLRAALREIRTWSQAHPRHVPVLVQLELKIRRVLPGSPDDPTLRERLAALPAPREWDAAQFAALEAAIRAELAATDLLTPDDVRGEAPTLRDALATRGWPLLEAVRGRIFFALDNEGAVRDRYLGPEQDGRGRLLFVSVPPDHPAAGWMKVNDPVRDFARIQDLVRRGFLVRTRADEELREARADDGTRRERALASGAHFISTDFPEADPRYSDYAVRLPGGVTARLNPVVGEAKSNSSAEH
ncbi:hypothetical protein ESB00_19020 [Oleiharenicola lentus]|uniref:Phosphatidylinositol diacylglycerol-lyase n=1 Tax=Oleiharenicola lentus TaxID=2508720 RepID=A0A4Q1C5R8_9BACT|nr:Ca2+-dependent phosphoinositide-specific phospholipase C [Oleiharenicola lentus]RXK53778.1 hypothetical protein ESB00_19020 [Oleiharenicola lentus]